MQDAPPSGWWPEWTWKGRVVFVRRWPEAASPIRRRGNTLRRRRRPRARWHPMRSTGPSRTWRHGQRAELSASGRRFPQGSGTAPRNARCLAPARRSSRPGSPESRRAQASRPYGCHPVNGALTFGVSIYKAPALRRSRRSGSRSVRARLSAPAGRIFPG